MGTILGIKEKKTRHRPNSLSSEGDETLSFGDELGRIEGVHVFLGAVLGRRPLWLCVADGRGKLDVHVAFDDGHSVTRLGLEDA